MQILSCRALRFQAACQMSITTTMLLFLCTASGQNALQGPAMQRAVKSLAALLLLLSSASFMCLPVQRLAAIMMPGLI